MQIEEQEAVTRTDRPLQLETRPLTMEHLANAASLTSQAFQSTPSYREIVPNPSQRAAFLPWLFERNFWLRLGSESAYCVFDDDELVMFFMLEMSNDASMDATGDIAAANAALSGRGPKVHQETP